MNEQPTFTVVIACYNTAPFLGKALGSVAAQTHRDFEAICYVEESTDESLAICRECGIGRDDLKAVLTPDNALWDAEALCGELAEEHKRMGM